MEKRYLKEKRFGRERKFFYFPSSPHQTKLLRRKHDIIKEEGHEEEAIF